MKTTGKLSKLASLNYGDQEIIFRLCAHNTYAKVVRILAKPREEGGLGIKTNESALCRFNQDFGVIGTYCSAINRDADAFAAQDTRDLHHAIYRGVQQQIFKEVVVHHRPIDTMPIHFRVYFRLQKTLSTAKTIDNNPTTESPTAREGNVPPCPILPLQFDPSVTNENGSPQFAPRTSLEEQQSNGGPGRPMLNAQCLASSVPTLSLGGARPCREAAQLLCCSGFLPSPDSHSSLVPEPSTAREGHLPPPYPILLPGGARLLPSPDSSSSALSPSSALIPSSSAKIAPETPVISQIAHNSNPALAVSSTDPTPRPNSIPANIPRPWLNRSVLPATGLLLAWLFFMFHASAITPQIGAVDRIDGSWSFPRFRIPSAAQMRKTKIIATLGPATESPEMIRKMIAAGVNIFRLNMSHGAHDWVRKIVNEIRSASAALGTYTGILMDTQGPAIRTGDLPAALDLHPGQKFWLTVRGEKSEELNSVDVNYDNLINDISVGDTVLVDNGEIEMKVLAKQANRIECEVLTRGTLRSRRHINLPGVKVNLPALTSKDLADIAVGIELKVDFIALSFVREAKDIRQLRAVVDKAPFKPVLVAKLEDQEAVRNMQEIIAEADAVMVARGDLGIEIPYEELPITQRRIVKSCLKQGKPVIVATHMLESMIDNPMPTRAEITDVANAVFEQADAIMLSGETTVGKYPLKCIEVFNRISERIEKSGGANYQVAAELTTTRQKLVKSAVVMANELKAAGMLVFTRHGTMAKYAAWMRPHYSPIFAVCPDAEVAETLALFWGVYPVVVPFTHRESEPLVGDALKQLLAANQLKNGDQIVIVSSIATGTTHADAIQMRTIGEAESTS